MKRTIFRILLAAIPVSLLATGISLARGLSFEERLAAQEAIERVYHSHQIGTALPFQEAVPRALLEKKVRRYLRQSAALETLWNTPITDEMLGRELQRMAAGTKLPERLLELYAALGNDPFLIKECLARQVLVDRLTRNFFAFDAGIHAGSREQANEIRRQLVDSDLDPWREHPARSVVEMVMRDPGEGRSEDRPDSPQPEGKERPFRLEQSPAEYRKQRAIWPRQAGEVGNIEEDRDAFVVRVVLSDAGEQMRGASYRVTKVTWDEWWQRIEGRLPGERIESAAQEGGVAPRPALAGKPDLASGSEAFDTPYPEVSTGPPCGSDNTWNTGILDQVVAGRSYHSAVWTGSLMIVWGGWNGSGVYNTGGRYDPATDTWAPTSTTNAPPARMHPTAVWTGSLMIVWGGDRTDGPPGYFSTGGRYDPSADTWTPTSMTNVPEGRWSHTAVWTGSRMIVWGGFGSFLNNAGGQYDPATDTWTPTSTTNAPQGRGFHTAVWTGSLMIVWGGQNGNAVYNTGGRYDPATDTWTPTSMTGAPSGRWGHAAVWTGSLMIIWGGSDAIGTSNTNTGGRYNPATDTWTATSTVSTPNPALEFAAVWTGNLMIVWGGYYGGHVNTGGRYNPATDTWTPTSTANAPQGRKRHTAVWTGSLMVVWGGDNDSTLFTAGGRYNPATDTWTPTSLNGNPVGRWSHTSVWTGNLMVVWAGKDGVGYLNSGGRYNPTTDVWTPTSTTNAPVARADHSAVWTGSLMVVWGGYTGTSRLNTGGRYDPAADVWTATSTTSAPAARSWHTAVWTGSSMVVWGGFTGSINLNTGGRYNPTTDTWTSTSTTNAAATRYDHGAVWTGSLMIVWGGTGVGGSLSTGGRYDPAANTWTPTSNTNTPSGRVHFTPVWTGTVMVVWGGYDGTSYLYTGGRYNPATDTWTPTSINLSERESYTAIWTGSAMVVWGGWNLGGYQNTGGRYDPGTDSWTFTSLENVPPARYLHTAIWTGSLMLVWGGNGLDFGGGAPLGSGAGLTLSNLSNQDGDAYPVCAGDCDDTHSTVYPGAAQICDGVNNDCNMPAWPSLAGTNEADTDGDTFSTCQGDCSDANALVWLPPVEVANLNLTGSAPTNLTWNSQDPQVGPETNYDLVSGSLGAGGNFASGVCLQSGGNTTHTDGRAQPGAGTGYWYLVRGQNSCGVGTYGSIQRDASIPSCP